MRRARAGPGGRVRLSGAFKQASEVSTASICSSNLDRSYRAGARGDISDCLLGGHDR